MPHPGDFTLEKKKGENKKVSQKMCKNQNFSNELGLEKKNSSNSPKKANRKKVAVLCACFRLSIRIGQKPPREPESF